MALKWVGLAYKDAQSNYEIEETNVGRYSLMVCSINHYVFYHKKMLCVFYNGAHTIRPNSPAPQQDLKGTLTDDTAIKRAMY